MSIGAIDVEGVWWLRCCAVAILCSGPTPGDGRWQRGEIVGGMYFADTEEPAWAEWYRALAEFAIPPERQMPRDLCRWQLAVEGVADLSAEDELRSVRLMPPHPAQSEWPVFPDVGERLWREGYRGVLAPSASRPSRLVLCLFREAEEVAGAEPLRPPMTYRRAPAPPTGLTT